ncbi:MAG: S9 family peptidase [candidate division WOR-3 bacterium]|nr:S9 family peptidase [candidate division WOR-3 bacterium]MDW8150929.1 S9 family peptidase [candidate division WOR-3 bacterium]
MKKLTEKDIFKLKFLGSIKVFSNYAIFVVSYMDEKENGYISHLYMANKRSIKRITYEGKRNVSPKVSKDKRFLAFLSDRHGVKDKGLQIYYFKAGIFEPIKLTDEKEGISEFFWTEDNKILFIKPKKKNIDSPYKKDSDIHIIERLSYKYDNVGYFENYINEVYLLDLTGKKKLLFKSDRALYNLRLKKNKLYFISNLEDDWDYKVYSYIYQYDINTRKIKRLLDGNWDVAAFEIYNDQIIFLGSKRNKDFSEIKHFYKIEEGKVVDLTPNLDRNPYNSLNSDSRFSNNQELFILDGEQNIYFLMTDGPRCSLCVLKDGKVEKLIYGDFSVESFDIDSQGNVYHIRQSFTNCGEVYINQKKISSLNEGFSKSYKLKEPEYIKFKSSDGVEVEGFVLKPYHDNKKLDSGYPAILEIHGGPRTAYGYAFMFEFHLLAHQGYYVMFSNPRGSDGYGFEFANRIVKDYGNRDYLDIMEFVDEVLKRYADIDKDRIGVTGGSYGGFMTNLIITRTDRFKLALTQRSISNWLSFFGTSDIGWIFGDSEIGGNIFDNFEEYIKRSPLFNLKNVKTPLLILHTDKDYRCPLEQAEQLFTGLRILNKEVKLIVIPDESHELSRSGKPKHRVERLYHIVRWFDRL